MKTYYAAAAIVFVVPPADSPGREALIAHAPRRFGNLAGAKGRGPSPSKKMKGGKGCRTDGVLFWRGKIEGSRISAPPFPLYAVCPRFSTTSKYHITDGAADLCP